MSLLKFLIKKPAVTDTASASSQSDNAAQGDTSTASAPTMEHSIASPASSSKIPTMSAKESLKNPDVVDVAPSDLGTDAPKQTVSKNGYPKTLWYSGKELFRSMV